MGRRSSSQPAGSDFYIEGRDPGLPLDGESGHNYNWVTPECPGWLPPALTLPEDDVARAGSYHDQVKDLSKGSRPKNQEEGKERELEQVSQATG